MGCARIGPVKPPVMNKETKPRMKSKGVARRSPPAKYCRQPLNHLDRRRNRNGNGNQSKGAADVRVHSADKHVVTPDRKSQQSNGDGRGHHGSVGSRRQRMPGEGGQQRRCEPHGRKDRDVDLRMAEEPEQVLPQQWRSSGMVQYDSIHHIDRRKEEAGAKMAIAEQHATRRQQNGKGRHHHAGSDEPGPYGQWHLHPLHSSQAPSNDSGDDADRTQQGTDGK